MVRVLPTTFATGDILEADDLNLMNTARTDSMLPIDDTTREVEASGGSLGSVSAPYNEVFTNSIKTSSNGDLEITPNGTGKIKTTNLITKSTIDIVYTQSPSLSDVTQNTIVQATSDLLLYFSFQLAGNGNRSPYNFCDFTILSDSASTPTSIRHTTQLTTQTNVDETTGSLVYVYFSYFVKKGEYYTVRQRNVGAGADRYITSTVRYIKLEIGN